MCKLVDYGDVFKLRVVGEKLIDEIERISKYSGTKYIIIEDYSLYIKQIKMLNLFQSNDIKLILTSRSLIHDAFYLQLINALNYNGPRKPDRQNG